MLKSGYFDMLNKLFYLQVVFLTAAGFLPFEVVDCFSGLGNNFDKKSFRVTNLLESNTVLLLNYL